MTTRSPSPPGLDLGRLAAWAEDNLPRLRSGRLEATLIVGGKSNLTYRLAAGGKACVLRRPPLGHVLSTAHDMSREYRVMYALQSTTVPVPQMLAHCEDPAVIGAPFYLMSYVEGTPYRRARELAGLGQERVRAISARMVDTLVALHDVDYRAVGLEDFGRPDGFVGRQVRRWKRQIDSSHSRDLPDAEKLFTALLRRLPEDREARIVHGDLRLDNLLIDASDQPAAVIDWEMATLGDPLTDLALMVVYQRIGELAGSEAVADASSAPGFLSEDEVLDRYAITSGRDLADLGFYLALASFKLAAILEGIHYRYLRGETVGPGFDAVGALPEQLLASGLTSLKETA
ncbi:MAG: phosphotransferase family protein [Kribbellaceae bacterium]|nr:phosphotransferase family protein [Kribbellaceae bacterium]